MSDEPALMALVEYLDHKTLGYDAKGLLQLAFAAASMEPKPRRLGQTLVRAVLTVDDGLHALRNAWTQTRKLREHCENLAAGFDAAVAATVAAVPKRGKIGFQMGTLPDGARKTAAEYSSRSCERSLEQEIFATLGPDGTFHDNHIVGRIVAYQVPLFDSRSRAGWGHIDLLGLTASGHPVVIELKRGESRETPLRCMIEGVANAIAVRENWPEMRDAIRGIKAMKRDGVMVADFVGPITTVVMAPVRYWAAWEPEGQPGYAVNNAARAAFTQLCDISGSRGFPVLMATVNLSAEVAFQVVSATSFFAGEQGSG